MTTTSTSTLQGTVATPVTGDVASDESVRQTGGPDPVAAEETRYTLGEELARGGLGRIVKGYDRRLARPVAIKELLPENDQSPSSREARFAVEALLTAQLEHPNIIPVHDTGRLPGGGAFYAMKLVSGRSLAVALAERPTLAARLDLLPHIVDVADAIAYAHSRGVVHRDLKPQNVLIGSFGETVVIDWGIAQLIDGGHDPGTDAPAPLAVALAGALDTHLAAGSILGTPEYMAPEQALGQPVDRRFDVFGIGAILFHALTGNPPLKRTPGPIREQVVAGPAARIKDLAPDAPRELVAIAERAMARDPAERYASAAELALDLKRFGEGQRVLAYAYTSRDILWRWVRRWRLALMAATVAFVSLVLALVVVTVDRATLSRALTSAEQRELAAKAREHAANEREASARGRELDAVRRADTVLVDQARLESGRDPSAALRLLAQLSPDFGEPLRARVIAAAALVADVPRVLGRLDGGRFELAIAPDGEALAWASADGSVHLIHADGRRETRAHLPREGTAVAYSDDGRLVAVGSGDGAVHVVDVSGVATPARHLGSHGSQITGLAFSPDGKKLASAATEPGLRLWDLATGAVQVLASTDTYLFGLGWSGDGRWLATSGASGTITVHAIGSPPVAPSVYDAHGLMGARFEFSPDGRLLLAQDMDGKVELVSLATHSATNLAELGASAGFASDGKTIVVAHDDGVVDVLDVARLDAPLRRLTCGAGGGGAGFGASGRQFVVAAPSGVCVFETETWERSVLVGHDGGVLRSYVAKSGTAIATIDQTGRLLLHRAATTAGRTPPAQVYALGAPVNDVALAPDGLYAAATAGDAVYLMDVSEARARPLAELPSARRAAFSPDGTMLAASGRTPAIVLYDFATDVTHELVGETAPSDIAFSPDGLWLATSSGRDGGVRVWDLVRSEASLMWAHDVGARAVAWSHDGHLLASVGYDRKARLFDRQTGREATFETPGKLMYRVVFSDDDALVAVSGDDGTCVWRVADGVPVLCDASLGRALALGFSGRALIIASGLGAGIIALDGQKPVQKPVIRELGGHRELMYTAVSPEGSRLATSDFAGTVRLWEIASGEGRLLAEHPGGMVATLAFSADGRLVASGGLDGRVIVTRDELPLEPVALRRRIAALARERE